MNLIAPCMKLIIGSAVFICCFCSLCSGQNACDDKIFNDLLLDKLVGKWNLEGEVANERVRNDVSAQWVLKHQFLELTLTDVANPPAYVAKVFIGFDCVSERYVVHWIDSFGGRFSETLGYGQKKDQAIEFRFEYPQGPFLNQFSYDKEKNIWQFLATTKNDKGEWITFAKEYLHKK
jgi:hypothetical protein